MAFTNLLLGTDVVHVPRLEAIRERHGNRFFQRLLTEAELAYCLALEGKASLRSIAVRIAFKEAVSKALGVGLNGLGWGEGVDWHEIEVVSAPKAPPSLLLHGHAKLLSERAGVSQWKISLAHDGDVAFATVIGLI